MPNYIPKVGDSVSARRKVKSQYHNLIVGPVTEVCEYGCKIVTNDGTEIQREWTVFYKDWAFDLLPVCDCPISGFSVTHKQDCPEGHGG